MQCCIVMMIMTSVSLAGTLQAPPFFLYALLPDPACKKREGASLPHCSACISRDMYLPYPHMIFQKSRLNVKIWLLDLDLVWPHVSIVCICSLIRMFFFFLYRAVLLYYMQLEIPFQIQVRETFE